jgi:hypothetical protein
MHRHTDIFLPIDASQEVLLNAIDGNRSMREIIRVAENDSQQNGNHESAIAFIKRLWRYDQIVIDTSGS